MPESHTEVAAVDEPVEIAEIAAPSEPSADDVVTDDLLVEEVSIDGMCGVY